MAFEYPGDGSLDYFPCRYGTSRLLFRGPRRDLNRPYIAVLGGTETYGKFVAEPFPMRVEAETGLRLVNLGLVNASPDAFLKDDAVLELARNAQLCVVQIMGAQNLTNRYYSVHPRRNDRFVSATPFLRAVYRDVDFTEFHFTRHLLYHLEKASSDRFEVVAEELRATWVRQMTALLKALRGRVLLLWIGRVAPPSPGRRTDLHREPLLVDCEMIASIRPKAQAYLEVHLSDAALAEGMGGLVLGPMDAPAASGLPGAMVHDEVARALGPRLMELC